MALRSLRYFRGAACSFFAFPTRVCRLTVARGEVGARGFEPRYAGLSARSSHSSSVRRSVPPLTQCKDPLRRRPDWSPLVCQISLCSLPFPRERPATYALCDDREKLPRLGWESVGTPAQGRAGYAPQVVQNVASGRFNAKPQWAHAPGPPVRAARAWGKVRRKAW